MSSFNDFLENEVLDHVFGLDSAGGFPQPTALWVALYTAAPTDAGAGTEVTFTNGYARANAGIGATNWTRSGNSVTNDNNIDLGPASGGSWGTVLAMAILSLSTGGNYYMWDAFTGVAINDGDTARFAASTGITVTLD